MGMDPKWLDRDRMDREIQGVEMAALGYSGRLGRYVVAGVPFTGACKRRGGDGLLAAVGHFKDGVPEGVSVSWYASGQIKIYSEMADDVYHGWHIEWDADGTKTVEEYYDRGRLVSKPTG
jgi:hypothetical protein